MLEFLKNFRRTIWRQKNLAKKILAKKITFWTSIISLSTISAGREKINRSRWKSCLAGLPDFLVKHTKTRKNLPNDYKIYQMTVVFTKWP
jgi:hypothetical protein